MINGKIPYVNAQVYDIQQGFGTIVQVEADGAFVVDFKGGRVLRYSTGGYVGRSRRVYWNNPIIVEPEDDDKEIWASYVGVAKTIYGLLRGLTTRYRK